jgi:hypothetical protein
MTSFLEAIAHENYDDQRVLRRTLALAHTRLTDRFAGFMKAASTADDLQARSEFIADEATEIIKGAADDQGYTGDLDAAVLMKGFLEGLGVEVVTSRTASIHEARKPKLCPYHSEVVDISLAQGEPQAGFNAMAQHAWSDKHCQGGDYEGAGCNFKREMTTQSYWDDKAQKAEERKQEREEQATLEQPTFGTPEHDESEAPVPDEPTNSPEVVDTPAPSEGEGIGDNFAESAPEPEAAMSMAASRAPLGVGSREAAPQFNTTYEDGYRAGYSAGKQGLPYAGKDGTGNWRNGYGDGYHDAEDGNPPKVASTREADNALGLGGPSPKMDKRRWNPTREPIRTEGEDSPWPTHRKDITKKIIKDQGDRDNPSKLDEIGENTTERQDVTQGSGFNRGQQGGTFSGDQAKPVTAAEIVASYKRNL